MGPDSLRRILPQFVQGIRRPRVTLAACVSQPHSARLTQQPGARQKVAGNLRFAAVAFVSLALVGFVAHVVYSVRLLARESAVDLYIIGTEYVDGADYVRAIETLRRAISLDPSDARPFYELGNAYYFSGADPEAAVAWEEALRLDPLRQQGRVAAGLARPPRQIADAPPAAVHADPDEIWNRSWNLVGGFSRRSAKSQLPQLRQP